MSLINITNIIIEDNPAPFQSPLKLNISFEVLKEITEEVHWELIYLGSAKDEKYDQVLDSFDMGPFSEVGTMQFVLESQAPDYIKIPSKDDILGITAIILTVSYQGKEFYRCGFYVYNSYTDEQFLETDTPEAPIQIEKVQRNILADKPRVTKFDVRIEEENQQQQQEINETNVLQDGQNSLNQLLNFNQNSNLDGFNLNQKIGLLPNSSTNKFNENNQNSQQQILNNTNLNNNESSQQQFNNNPFSFDNFSQNNSNLNNRMGAKLNGSGIIGFGQPLIQLQQQDQVFPTTSTSQNQINDQFFNNNGNLIDSSSRNNNQLSSFF